MNYQCFFFIAIIVSPGSANWWEMLKLAVYTPNGAIGSRAFDARGENVGAPYDVSASCNRRALLQSGFVSRSDEQTPRHARTIDRADSFAFYQAMDSRHGLFPRVSHFFPIGQNNPRLDSQEISRKKNSFSSFFFLPRLHDRKLCVLGLCTLISMGPALPASVTECAQQIIPSLILLFDGLKRAYAAKVAEGEEEENEDEESDNEEGEPMSSFLNRSKKKNEKN